MVTKHRSLPDTQTHTNVEWREEADVKPPFTTTPSTALHHSVSTRCLPRVWQPELRRRIIGRQAELKWMKAWCRGTNPWRRKVGRGEASSVGVISSCLGKNTSKEKLPYVLIKTKWHTWTYHTLSCERFLFCSHSLLMCFVEILHFFIVFFYKNTLTSVSLDGEGQIWLLSDIYCTIQTHEYAFDLNHSTGDLVVWWKHPSYKRFWTLLHRVAMGMANRPEHTLPYFGVPPTCLMGNYEQRFFFMISINAIWKSRRFPYEDFQMKYAFLLKYFLTWAVDFAAFHSCHTTVSCFSN